MAYRYQVEEETLGDGEQKEIEVNVSAGETFENITALEVGGSSLDNTKFSLKIPDTERITPYISLSALGKTQEQAFPMMYEATGPLKLKGAIINNTGASRTVRVAFRIKLAG